MNFLTNYLSGIFALCKKHRVRKLFAFGSDYFSLKDALSGILHRDIDLLEDKAIRNPILRKRIDNSKQLIYG